jgi:tetratricopeptide (TPR) repeat protein
MKGILILLLASAAMVFARGDECSTLDDCANAITANPKSSLAHYQMGTMLFRNHEWTRAAAEFREAQRGDLDPLWTEAWAHIYAGMTYDLLNERDRAVNEYKLALRTNDNNRGALRLAAKYLDAPYTLP